MIDKIHFPKIIQEAKQGSLIGIGFSLTFMIVFEKLPSDPLVWVSYIVMGLVSGFFITLGNACFFILIDKIYAKFNRIIGLQLLASYFINVLIFYTIVTLINLIFPPGIIAPDLILNVSLGVGLGSLMVTLFFINKSEKDEKLRLETENRELAVIGERNRIARELHDSVSQNLFGISLNLNTIQHVLEGNPAKAREMLNQIRDMIEETQTEMRLMIYELRPAALTEKGFLEAIEELLRLFRVRYGLEINYSIEDNEEVLDSPKQIILYRILQESLNNVVKHAKATLVTVRLGIRNGSGELVIEDNGRGFDSAEGSRQSHLGIKGMEERVNQLNGEFKIITQAGRGTIVYAKV